ncbi:60S ribosomal protein L18a-like protein isoform X2 [Asparagus officinalis]|uniref:60S ribosomal protein L18a-like protein isoform X2 n=1 Tax=Asparagus officinalis TaxID=4686 RepID=UPI00098E5BAA|nr:60S ribosomal protein L18a-like protein isoform X2 [Asparagus officinalis]XP_020265154.1 60S ribosomal protein L18a-like protein isoform X2 [Asparagus officinalis]
MSEEERRIVHQYQQYYGTFQQVPGSYYPPPPAGIPQPVPPPPSAGNGQPPIAPYSAPYCYANGYQPIPVYNGVAEGRPLTVRMQRLPCCGLGIGWFLFIIGFFLAAIPWYVGAFILLCVRVDYREKPGFAACTIADQHQLHEESYFEAFA